MEVILVPENVGGYGCQQKLKNTLFDSTGIRFADSDIENWLKKQDVNKTE